MGILNRRGLAVATLALGLVVMGCSADDNKGSGTTETTKASNGGGSSGGGTGDVADGTKQFDTTCAACHGKDAKGLPNLGKDLTKSQFAMGLSDAELVAFIKKGRDTSDPANTTGVAMPPKGGNPALTDKQLNDIVAYLRTLEK